MVIGYDEDNAGGTAAEVDGSDRQSIEVSSRRTSRCLILSVVTRPTHSSDANSRQRGLPQNAGSAGTYTCTISARAHDIPTTQPRPDLRYDTPRSLVPQEEDASKSKNKGKDDVAEATVVSTDDKGAEVSETSSFGCAHPTNTTQHQSE